MRRKYNMETIRYERTWCDYLTPCPYLRGIMVGDWECDKCHYNKGDTSLTIVKGEVTCSYKEEHQDESDNKCSNDKEHN